MSNEPKKPKKSEPEPKGTVKISLYVTEEENWIIEGIVRERKRRTRGYSKNEYFRELMRGDPVFAAAEKPKK